MLFRYLICHACNFKLQVAQLAQDRADLQGKLTQLEQLVKRVVVKEEVKEEGASL